MAMRILITCFVVLSFALTASVGETGISAQTEKEVKDFLDRQARAFVDRDLEALMAMLAPDASVVMLGNGPDDRWVGPGQIQEAYSGQMAQYISETFKLTWTSIGGKGNIAWFAAQCLIVQTRQPKKQVTFRINWTGVLEKRKAKWLLVQSHFSFPAPEPGK